MTGPDSLAQYARVQRFVDQEAWNRICHEDALDELQIVEIIPAEELQPLDDSPGVWMLPLLAFGFTFAGIIAWAAS